MVQKCLDLGASSAHYVVSDMGNLTSAQKLIKETKNLLGKEYACIFLLSQKGSGSSKSEMVQGRSQQG